MDYNDICYKTEEHARKFVRLIKQHAKKEKMISIAELYLYSGDHDKITVTDYDYGWTYGMLSSVNIQFRDDRYFINLPNTIKMRKKG